MTTLSMKFLSGLGIEDEKAELICERHKEVLTEIKEERDNLKEKAGQLEEVQRQLDELKKEKASSEKDPYKVKYEAIKEEFEAFKKDVETKEITAKKEAVYKALLEAAGVSEKRIPTILKVTDLASLELDDEGKAKDADKLTETIKTEWSDFIQTTGQQGATVATPPATVESKQDLSKLSMAEYIKARKEMN